MLPKVDYVLITSLFVCIKMITMLDIFPSFDEPYEVIVCNLDSRKRDEDTTSLIAAIP